MTLVQETFAAAWSTGFRLLGRARASRAKEVRFGDDGRVLVITPHPDDEVIGCGGAILRHVAAGDSVCVAYVTDGRRSRALGLSPDQMAATRKGEAEAAAAHLRIDRLEWLGQHEDAWQRDEVRSRLCELLRRCKPTIIYAPSRVDFHPEHHAVARALSEALANCYPGAPGPRIRVFQIQVPLGAALVNRVTDVSGVAAAHHSALEAHASQKGSIVGSLRVKRYAALAHGSGTLAEEFWEMTTEDYFELHREGTERWRGRFRGVRYLALSDPPAYLVGRSERRRLAELVSRP